MSQDVSGLSEAAVQDAEHWHRARPSALAVNGGRTSGTLRPVAVHELLERARDEEPLLARGQELRRRVSELIEHAREHERQELRVFLHDTVLQTLEYIAGGAWGEGMDLDELQCLAARQATELRERLEALRPEQGSGLVEGLQEAVEEARSLGGRQVLLVVGPIDEEIPDATASVLTQAAREALTNVRKHAGASRVVVYCEAKDGEALVTVKDDGKGLDVEDLDPGIGLRESIFERLRRHAGDARLESSPGEGTLVTMRMSCKAVSR